MQDILEYFDSITDFAEAVNTRPENPVMKGKNASQDADDPKWYGTRDYTEAEYFLKCGDWDKMGAFTKMDCGAGFNVVSDKTSPKVRNCEYGGTVNVARYINGDPKCMRRVQRVHRRDNVVSIVYQCNMTCGYTSEQIEANGRKIATIVKSLETIGYRVSLYVISCSYAGGRSGQYMTTIVKVKDSGEPLSQLALTYPVCNTSFFRRHIFRYKETCPEEMHSRWRSGYGTSEDNAKIVKEKIGGRIKGAFRLLTSYDLIKITNKEELVKYLDLN